MGRAARLVLRGADLPPFGTAAEYAVVPVEQAVPLPAGVSAEQGACLGIPGITAHRGLFTWRVESRGAPC